MSRFIRNLPIPGLPHWLPLLTLPVWLALVATPCGFPAEGAPAAQDDPSAASPLTLERAVELALERNPEMLVSKEGLNELRGKITEVRSQAFPQVTFQGYGLRLRDPSILNSSSFDDLPDDFRDLLVPHPNNMFNLGLNVRQPVYNAGKVSTALELAKVSLTAADAESEAVRRQLTFRVFQAFHDLLLAQANLGLVLDTQRQREEHLRQARTLFDNGVATEVDVLRSEVAVANLAPDVIRSRNMVRLARSALNNLIMVDIDAPTVPADTLRHRPWGVETLESLQARALGRRPEVEAARKQVAQMRLAERLAGAENKLNVDMEGQWGFAARKPQNLFDNDYSSWNLTFSFKLPLFDGGRKSGLVRQASARVRAAEQRLALVENNVRLEVKQAYDAMQSSAEAIAAARLGESQADRVFRMMQDNYRYGAATTLDVTDAETALSAARTSGVNAIYEYEVAKARLRLAAGIPILDTAADAGAVVGDE
ncbi:MAG: TolC family protein [Acidobacteriota bacterium]|jgi:outer membrane protein TolC|nr:TolC family protein [Acidobacteriota bacterium]